MTALFTIKEAAAALRVSASLLYSLAGQGRISCFKINRRILFSQEQIDSFLEAVRHGVTVPAGAARE
jgi:excisionase family DNA binding protein